MERELAAHGPDCDECVRLFSEYGEAAADLALSLEPVPLSAGAEDRLMQLAAQQQRIPMPSNPTRRALVRRWVAPAVAATLLVAAGIGGYSLAPRVSDPTRVVALARGTQTLQVAYTPGNAEAWVLGTNVPKTPAGKVYELWYQGVDGADLNPAGTFTSSGGTVASPAKVGSAFVALAVSVEPEGGSLHPTTNPVYFARI